MVEEHSEWKEIVREILHQGAIDLSKEQIVNKDGHEVRITPLGEGCTRFDLPRPQKTFIIMSGRLYSRPYMSNDDVPSGDGNSAETEKSEADESQVHLASQPSYTGEEEKVDTRIFKNKIMCKCGNHRFVKNSDMFQVKKCKPCTLKGRQDRRRK